MFFFISGIMYYVTLFLNWLISTLICKYAYTGNSLAYIDYVEIRGAYADQCSVRIMMKDKS